MRTIDSPRRQSAPSILDRILACAARRQRARQRELLEQARRKASLRLFALNEVLK
jgi:hypothetical protein